ncbi:hypothetical protein PoB_001154300 [Plakobranchus ocellatus]|uniref:Transposase n=1 Tax=Plakobranchus ocellatus TaxID=259542 RepID=A0AAV3YR53_9GAST|nr:hypothetical protein PoB_001154300 [Plakobranchus ocellatus]
MLIVQHHPSERRWLRIYLFIPRIQPRDNGKPDGATLWRDFCSSGIIPIVFFVLNSRGRSWLQVVADPDCRGYILIFLPPVLSHRSGKFEGKRSRGRQREKIMDGLATWLGTGKVLDTLAPVKDRELWRNMIANAYKQGT